MVFFLLLLVFAADYTTVIQYNGEKTQKREQPYIPGLLKILAQAKLEIPPTDIAIFGCCLFWMSSATSSSWHTTPSTAALQLVIRLDGVQQHLETWSFGTWSLGRAGTSKDDDV
jgi:hypothetical protein